MSTALPVGVAAGYELWAASYPQTPENPVMRLEEALMLHRWPQVAGRRVLDIGCGSGRYTRRLQEQGAEVVALDLSAAMLARVECGARVRADVARLPFAAESFEVLIAGLVVGHVPDLAAWFVETGRVLKRDGVLLYSDFHPAAAAAGMTRTFTDAQARTYVLPHYVHELAQQRAAAEAAGLCITSIDEGRVGIEMTGEFARSEEFYRRWHGLPLVLVAAARRR